MKGETKDNEKMIYYHLLVSKN